jgi:hypothetical protein
MFSQRWSTFSLLSLALAVAWFAFYCGRASVVNHRLAPEATPDKKAQSQVIFGKSAGPINSVTPKTENSEARWAELSAQPGTPAGENELAGLIEQMARLDPQRAISLAAAQTNLRLRAALLRAALKGWGATNPEAAAEWAQSETVMDRAQALNALLQGAVEDPGKAASLTAALIQKDSSRALEYGSDLISALSESGQFDRAANFAASGAEHCRDDWMLAAYSRWAEFQPQAAVASAMQLADPGVRATALNAITVGWSPTDPKGMVEYAQNYLPPEQQSSALSGAIGFWADSDPAAAAVWINQNDLGAASDTGVAEIALSPRLAQKPELAVGWAESISNPQLRLDTLAAVIEKWTAIDFSSAEHYVENSPSLAPEDRLAFRARLNNHFEP